MTYVRKPTENLPLFDYRRPCDRCGWTGWYRSQLSIEYVTNMVVCEYCLDNIAGQLDPNIKIEVREQNWIFD